jgi:hemerythrin superfamily protein
MTLKMKISSTLTFKKDDVIDHDTFGKGIVISNDHKKIEVLFTDRLRTLVCDR